jgi:hypothetical protein
MSLFRMISCFIFLSILIDKKADPKYAIALCSVYLLFGIALLAMSFNLVQEEVITKVKNVAKRLGIIKDDEVED